MNVAESTLKTVINQSVKMMNTFVGTVVNNSTLKGLSFVPSVVRLILAGFHVRMKGWMLGISKKLEDHRPPKQRWRE
jgi:hypothetical protein